ncbi:tRNA pseudouridine(38-40) synthase [Batrachochytrium salamandrivorans]|nr:tRNA pseudouridine(38-40) synthase [Batrachochytrium salamandrivorans]
MVQAEVGAESSSISTTAATACVQAEADVVSSIDPPRDLSVAISTFPLSALIPITAQENQHYEATYLAAQKRSSADFKSQGPEDGKNKKRKWGHAESSSTATQPAPVAGSVDPEVVLDNAPLQKKTHRPKKKVALLMSYCGTGYQGMQVNPDVPSIELDLHKALAASGAVSADNAMDPGKCGFMRCARTDKGVHAAGQIVSLKMTIEDTDIIEQINARLPAQIRVWGYARVPKHFHAKNHCDARIYEYLLPTYVLAPATPNHYPLSALGMAAGVTIENMGRIYAAPIEITKISAEEMRVLHGYRVAADKLDTFRSILSEYVGTHNYHNFTLGRKFDDKSSVRYIISFACSDPFIRSGMEWVSLKVKGQSFMLHQIRKMIGLAVMMMRTDTPAALIKNAFTSTRINIPKAPALGLLLERPLFENYNKQIQPKGTDRDLIDFDNYTDLITKFKDEWIYKAQAEEELKEGHFNEWTRVVDANSDDYGWYLSSDGSILEAYKPSYVHVGPSNRPDPRLTQKRCSYFHNNLPAIPRL